MNSSPTSDEGRTGAAAQGQVEVESINRRSFLGVLLGFGASAIGRLPQGYVQNKVQISAYSQSISAGVPPNRGKIILAIMLASRYRRPIRRNSDWRSAGF